MIRSIEVKLYPTSEQARTLTAWMERCCWVYNQALEHRIKAWERRRESVGLYAQTHLLVKWRGGVFGLADVPSCFARDAIRRVDRGMQAFFRRCKTGDRPGFPRFRSKHRYNSLESLRPTNYIDGVRIRIPKLGLIRFRGGDQDIPSIQKALRVIRRASGWFAQVLVDDGELAPTPKPTTTSIGIDVGLESFATLSDGEKIENPRWYRTSQRQLRSAHRRVSRRVKGSKNRRKDVVRLCRVHEKITARRKDFAHQLSRRLVNRFSLIGFEALNVSGMARSRLAKSILDAAWSMFLRFITYKAECAGKRAVAVNARGSSQECPDCGAVRAKSLAERVHRCSCGCVRDRDHAAAQVILARALGVAGATPVEELATGRDGCCHGQAGPVKQEVLR